MKINHLYAILALTAGCLFAGCHSDIDLDNIDKTANVKVGVAVPVGSINVKLGDFLGSGQVSPIVVESDGIFHYRDTLPLQTKTYHHINLASYFIKNETTLEFMAKDQLDLGVIPAGTQRQLRFNLELGLEGINNDLSKERIDSIQVTEAKFISKLHRHDFDINWDEIESVQLVLKEQFRRENGPVIEIPIEGKYFGDNIEINVRNFTLSLLKDQADPSKGAVDKLNFELVFNVRTNHDIAVKEDSKFMYNMHVELLDYKAIWGFFEASNELSDSRTVYMDSIWEGWKDIKNLELRIAKPTIKMFVTHSVAAPLEIKIEEIKAESNDGKVAYALWEGDDGNNYKDKKFELTIPHGEVLSPLTWESPLESNVTVNRTFSSESKEGQIDKLFDVRPDKFSYSYYLRVNPSPIWTDYPYTQHRITKELAVGGKAAIDVPFEFKDHSKLSYEMTFDSLRFDRIALDSILVSAKILEGINASEIKLHLQVENTIPFNIDARLYFLDENDQDMNIVFVQDSTENHLRFPIQEPGKEGPKYVISINEKDFDRVSQVKKLRFEAALMDNPAPCALKDDMGLKIRIALSAKGDIVLNFND